MPENTRWECIIDEDGHVVTNVLERGSTHCAQIRQFTAGIGKELSDEQTGPECDDVHEIQL